MRPKWPPSSQPDATMVSCTTSPTASAPLAGEMSTSCQSSHCVAFPVATLVVVCQGTPTCPATLKPLKSVVPRVWFDSST